MLAASRLNERTRHAVAYYRERLSYYVRAAKSEGYVVGTEPASDPAQEFEELSQQLPMLYQIAQRADLPEGYRQRAQLGMLRWASLWRKLYGAGKARRETAA